MTEIKFGEHMKLTPHGLEIEGSPSIEELTEVVKFLRWVTGAARMGLADALEFTKWQHGDDNMVQLQGLSADYIGEQQQMNLLRISQQFPYKFRSQYPADQIHYTHWHMLSRARLPAGWAEELLDRAVRENLNTTEFRKALKERLQNRRVAND